MSLNLPDNVKQVSDRMKTDIQNELPESNPFLKNSLIGAFVDSYAGRVFDFYLQLNTAISLVFPDTATGIYLERWGSWVGVTRNPATAAQGIVVATGSFGSVIPIGTTFQSTTSNTYTSTAAAIISNNLNPVTLLERTGQLVTATTSAEHGYATGQDIDISGATQPEYNGTFEVVVISPTQFQYDIVGFPLTPATGTIESTALMASVSIDSDAFGADQNLASGDTLTIVTPIAGVDSDAIANFFGVGGGTDVESDEDYRDRVQFRYQNPVALFNVNAIIEQAKTVPGVTRVWVEEITPEPGCVTVYFTRDNDPSPIPGPAQVQEVKDALLEIKPANTPDDGVIVLAPTPVVVDFNFTSLIPNTSTMQDAITASLDAYFADSTEVGESVVEDAYRCAIFGTVDPGTGEPVDTFNLTAPTGDIIVGPGELAILGTITYP